jgi:hypothetical protein
MIIAERQLPHNLLRYLVCGLNGYALGIDSTKQGFGLRRPRSGPSAFKGTSARWPHILPRHRNCAIRNLAIQCPCSLGTRREVAAFSRVETSTPPAGASGKERGKVPKSLAGSKIPKSLRKSGAITQFLNNDRGRRILADVLVAAAGAAAAALVQHRPSEAQVALAGEAALDSGQRAVTATAGAVQAAAGTLGSVLTKQSSRSSPLTTCQREKGQREGEGQADEGFRG